MFLFQLKQKVLVIACGTIFGFATLFVITQFFVQTGPIVGWKEAARLEANEFGSRGHKIGINKPTVILLGDSQVETSRPFNKMPEVFLAKSLQELTGKREFVTSIGSSGWGQDQELLALKEALTTIRPRVVCLWLTPGNDFFNNTFPTNYPRNGTPKPTFWLSNGVLRGPNARWMHRQNQPLLYLFRRLWNGKDVLPYTTDEEWEKILPESYFVMPPDARAIDLNQHLLSMRVKLDLSLENFHNEKTHFASSLFPRSARFQYTLQLTRALIREIQKECESKNVRFTIILPERQTPTPLFSEEPRRYLANGGVVMLSRKSQRDAIQTVLRGFPLIQIPLTGDLSLSNADSHFNDQANSKFMKEVARSLYARHLLQ